jgi:3-hydroxyacyl-CoA dehydrogenase
MSYPLASLTPDAIQTATVIGAGTMGAAIAGHLANAGLTVHLLDIVPTVLTPAEADAGLALDAAQVRNRIVRLGFERMLAARPANLFAPSVAGRITLGNLEDDLAAAVAASDWVIEAIVEQAAPKQALMERLEPLLPSHTVVSTNTSGIPIREIGAGRSADFRRRLLGVHFFNPPRYLPLVEVIPTADTDPALTAALCAFLETRLGKCVVRCKDTPYFIANRLVSFILADLIAYAVEQGYTVAEVDVLTGPLLGRPRSGTFRLHDIVGVDVFALIADNLYALIPHDPDRDALVAPVYRSVLQTLLDHGHLGAKTGQGFYKTVMDANGGKEFWALDLQAARRGELAYLPPAEPAWPSVDAVAKLSLTQRLAELWAADHRAARLVRHTLLRTFAYASQRIPEISDTIEDIDHVLEWGFGWEMGPFAMWDSLGVATVVNTMQAADLIVAPWVARLQAADYDHFYRESIRGAVAVRQVYQPATAAYVPQDIDVPQDTDPRILRVNDLRRQAPPLVENRAAALHDLGDRVLLLEFHSKLNALDRDLFPVLDAALDRLHGDAAGLVIANDGVHFSAGANLRYFLERAQAADWAAIEEFIRRGQGAFLALRTAPRPVVAAPFQFALGGGLEVCLASHHITAHAESALGLVETGVGLIPGWGGCKEMVRRHVRPGTATQGVERVFDLISSGRVSTSALEAQELGLLAPDDEIVMHRGHLIMRAKAAVLDRAGTHAPAIVTQTVYAAGRAGRDALWALIDERRREPPGRGRYSEHDALIGRELAIVLCGDAAEAAMQDEQTFLEREAAAFVRLLATPATQARIGHMLSRGKPLRN